MTELEVRLPSILYARVRADLERSHAYAYEKVGFLFGKFSSGDDTKRIYLHDYQPVADDLYIQTDEVGALINQDAIFSAMQLVRSSRGSTVGVFHVHCHSHRGKPSLSRTDRRSLPGLIASFQRMNPMGAHGLIVLSEDHASAWVWSPDESESRLADTVAVVGVPTLVYQQQRRIL